MNVKNVENNIDSAVQLLKSLSNKNRLAVLCALYNTEKSVGELERIINISQSALSQHLARLRRDGLVETRREAQTIYYSMTSEAARAVLLTLYNIYTP